jgi:hypothetical protein
MMKRIFILILIFAFVFNVQAQQVNYYVVADQDDWQLFMSKNMTADCNGNKVVIITLTAGDEGNGANTFGGAATAYYLAKEMGAVYSSKFIRDINNNSIAPNNTYPLPTVQTVSINSKNLKKYSYGPAGGAGTVVNYFLRLPDGGSAGAGFAGTGNQSLQRLKLNLIGNMTSVDGANTYTWSQLTNTIYAIVMAEKGTDNQVYINTATQNTTTNPDHSDHYYSGMAAQEGVSSNLAVGIREFVMDNSSTLSANLTNEEFSDASALYGVYNWNLIRNRYSNALNSTVRGWLTMESSSNKRSPTGSLPVTLLDFSGKLKSNNVLLEWTTSFEINSKEFQIEKSTDGVTYSKLNTVAATGNSFTEKKYNYLDAEATEINYYRLKMVDIDGYTKQSNIIVIKNSGILSQSITVTNMPFTDFINVRFAKVPKGKTMLRLFDLSGRLISVSEKSNPVSSIMQFDNYNKNIAKGIYLLQVESEGKQFNIKIVKD